MTSQLQPWLCDSVLSDRFTLWTRANVGEVFPDPVVPFSKSLMLHSGAEMGWRDAWVRMGAFDVAEFNPIEMEVIGVFGGYCYLNASIIRLFGERAPGLGWRAMDEQFFGAQEGVPPYAQHDGDVRPDLSAKIGAWMGMVLTSGERADLLEDQRVTKQLRADRPDYSTLSDRELFALTVTHNDEHFRWLFCQHIHCTYAATVPVGILQAVCGAVGRLDLLGALISGVGNVDSAAPSSAMWALGRQVAASTVLTQEFNGGVVGLDDRLLSNPGAAGFVSDFAAFLYEFGSRGPNEWDTSHPTWETKPSLALSAIDRMRLAPDSAAPGGHQASLAQGRVAAANVIRPIIAGDAEASQNFELAFAAAAVWLASRERSKTNVVRMIHEMRMPMRELGRRFMQRGDFDEIEDFAFVFADEFDQLFDNPSSLLATIRERKSQRDEFAEHDPQFVFNGAPDFPEAWIPKSSLTYQPLAPGESLQGIPGCLGVAEGIARVILDSNDPSALQPGDVLVAPSTDPSWTPLFVPAAAVVVNVGAPLSHAVIVSRELGIPCVISATGATQRIPDGARVRVDGNTGVVTILD